MGRPAPWMLFAALLAVTLSGCVEPSPGPGDGTESTPAPAPTNFEPEASFSWDPKPPLVSEAVHFTGRLAPATPADEIYWDFGDGTSSRQADPMHAFRHPTTYTVTLIVKGDGWTATTSEDVVVVTPTGETSEAPPPVGEPVGPPTIRLEVQDNFVRFNYSWPAKALAQTWDFGDGASSTEVAPEHRYLATGEYRVALTVESLFDSATATTTVNIQSTPYGPRVVVGMTDSGINPYHATYYRPQFTTHPCTWVSGYTDCSVQELPLTVGPDGGSYQERLQADSQLWAGVRTNTWYWIPQTNIIAAHCPEPFTGDATDTGSYANPVCILDDTQTHGTQTTSSMLSEAPEALLVFNEGSDDAYLASAPVPIDIESNSWGSLAPLYGGYTNAAGITVCSDDIESPFSIKFRSAGNNGPIPNMGDCWRNGFRTYSVGGGYPNDQHGYLSGSTPDFASYWCRPAAEPHHVEAMDDSICGTSFAAPTAAGTAAAALLELRREIDFTGGSNANEVAPGISHADFMDAVKAAATYDPTPRDGFPSSNLLAYPTGPTPWLYWGWGWLHAEQIPAIVDCALGRDCPDNKSAEAWAFNDARRGFVNDS